MRYNVTLIEAGGETSAMNWHLQSNNIIFLYDKLLDTS